MLRLLLAFVAAAQATITCDTVRHTFQQSSCCTNAGVIPQAVNGCNKVTVVETFKANSPGNATAIRDTFNNLATQVAAAMPFLVRFELYSLGTDVVCIRDIETPEEASLFAAFLVKSFTSEQARVLFSTLGIQSIQNVVLQPSGFDMQAVWDTPREQSDPSQPFLSLTALATGTFSGSTLSFFTRSASDGFDTCF